MKVGLYLENYRLSGVDLSDPKLGNPGIGGTEFNFITLTYHLQHQYPESSFVMYANNTRSLSKDIQSVTAENCIDAINQAERDQCDLFVWRPTTREDSQSLLNNLHNYKISIIVWAHNTPKREVLNTLSESNTIARLVAVGHEQLKRIGSHPITSKAITISNGFDALPYKPTKNKSDSKIVVYLGSLIPAKGFGVLARAWKAILNKVPDAKLKVIGAGNLYDRHDELGAWGIASKRFEDEEIIPFLSDDKGSPIDSVEFLGVLGPDKAPLLSTANVGVVNPTGEGENCPGSAIEFLASGTPVVSAANQGILDVVEHKKTGLLGENDQDLINNISKLLLDPATANQLGENGPPAVQAKFNYQFICSQWHKLFKEEIYKSLDKKAANINDDHYFPYITQGELKLDRLVRRTLNKLPPGISTTLYSLYSLINPSRLFTRYRLSDGMWKVSTKHLDILFPENMPHVKWLHSSLNYPKWLLRKYSLPGLVEVEPGDLVIDCGSFVGGFSIGAAAKAGQIHIFEPAKDNVLCIEKNTADYNMITINKAGLFEKTGTVQFNVSNSPVEHSILQPDNNIIDKTTTISVYTIEDYCLEKKINSIDFLKVEAEGVKFEIIKGIGNLQVKKIAVDCSPEKNGKSPFEEIKALLVQKGYWVTRRGFNLYAKMA